MLFSLTLGRALRHFPAATALRTSAGEVTFSELGARIEGVAGWLDSNGFRAGDRLAVLLLNCPEYVEILYACARLGVIAVPLNTRYARAEIDAVLQDCSPKGIIRHAALPAPTAPPGFDIVLDDGPVPTVTTALPPVFHDPEAIFGLFYTSGTTGRAKGVMLTHGNLHANSLHTLPAFNVQPGNCWLHAAPMFHLADFPGLLLTVAQGCAQTTIPRWDPDLFCDAVARHRVTHSVLIPTMINFLTLHPRLAEYDLSSLLCIFYGGSPIAPQVLERARTRLGAVRFLQGYGMTETSPIITVLPHEDHSPDKLTSCGRTPYGVEAIVADAGDGPVPCGHSGEILTRGPHVMKGYWNQPEETARALRNGWMHTGDVGYQDADGFFYIVDRSKDMIVTGGENVYSTEVEAALYAHPAVREAAVIGIPDEQWGELVTACVVLRQDHTLTAEALTEHCRGHLANYKIPRRVIFQDSDLPKSGTGKILKRELRAPFWAQQSRAVG